MEAIELLVELRSEVGKGAARRTRRSGKVPAVFYGPKRPAATLITVDAKEFLQKVSALEGSHLIRFRSAAADVADKVALVKDAQYHPVTGDALHADFYEVDMTKQVRVRVPLHFTGKAIGVAAGGILQPVRRDVEAECLPTDIPAFVEVDVSALGIHEAVHVSELKPPSGVLFLFDDDFALVTVLPPTVEEVKVEAAEAAAEAAPAEGTPAAEVKAEPEKGEKKGAPAS
jgi:large subunit ribosomal protein L25